MLQCTYAKYDDVTVQVEHPETNEIIKASIFDLVITGSQDKDERIESEENIYEETFSYFEDES